MKPVRTTTFNKSPLAQALKMARTHSDVHVVKEYNALGSNQTEVFRKTVKNPVTGYYDKIRHGVYDSRTGKLDTMTHCYPHGQIYKDGEKYIAFVNKEGVFERHIDNVKDFFKFVREYLPKII